MSLPSVSIIGCGWLGLPLARALIRQGYPVKGSTTTLEKIPVLQKAGIFSFCLQAGLSVQGEGIEDFFDSDVIVMTLPFRRDFADPREYQKQIQAIVAEGIKIGKVRLVIFTSSTSVYPDHIATAREDLKFIPDTDRSKVLQDIENDLLGHKKFSATIVRLAGLYGQERKIGSFLSGQTNLSGGDCPMNLIHQDDAVGIIKEIIAQNAAGEIFNACSDVHPTRRELYTKAAQNMGLEVPQFKEETPRISKIVVNEKVKKVLGYKFMHPDPLKEL